jgi:hypothetical protein
MSEEFSETYLHNTIRCMYNRNKHIVGSGFGRSTKPYILFLQNTLTPKLQHTLQNISKKARKNFLIDLAKLYGLFSGRLGVNSRKFLDPRTDFNKLTKNEYVAEKELKKIKHTINSKQSKIDTPHWNELVAMINDYVKQEISYVPKPKQEEQTVEPAQTPSLKSPYPKEILFTSKELTQALHIRHDNLNQRIKKLKKKTKTKKGTRLLNQKDLIKVSRDKEKGAQIYFTKLKELFPEEYASLIKQEKEPVQTPPKETTKTITTKKTKQKIEDIVKKETSTYKTWEEYEEEPVLAQGTFDDDDDWKEPEFLDEEPDLDAFLNDW